MDWSRIASGKGRKVVRRPRTEAMRAFCKGYFDLKAEVARAGELTFIEGKIARLKREARGYEEKGGGPQADNQAAVLASFLGLQPVEGRTWVLLSSLPRWSRSARRSGSISRRDTLAARWRDLCGPSRGVTIVEGRVLKDISRRRPKRLPLKQIAGPVSGPRRVPRMKRNQNILKNRSEGIKAMGYVVPFMNGKGGTGKSVLARAYAVEAARSGASVLIADLDDVQRTTKRWADHRKIERPQARHPRRGGDAAPCLGHARPGEPAGHRHAGMD